MTVDSKGEDKKEKVRKVERLYLEGVVSTCKFILQ